VEETPADPGMVEALLAGPTRVAFRVPDTTTAIPFTLPALLNFAQFQMNVVPSALPPLAAGDVPSPLPELRAPTETETALETPWHLILSPHSESTFAHSLAPVVRNGRTELWHSRLAVRKPSATDPSKFVADELDAAKRTVRAGGRTRSTSTRSRPTPTKGHSACRSSRSIATRSCASPPTSR
jgi:hypothetical protein